MSATLTSKPQTTTRRTEAFDALFVDPVGAQSISARSTRTGWRQAPLVALLDAQPRERREPLLALGFALLAFVYGPLGIAAVVFGRLELLAAVTVIAGVVLAAPRPQASLLELRGLPRRATSS